jgi:hypothetical protein
MGSRSSPLTLPTVILNTQPNGESWIVTHEFFDLGQTNHRLLYVMYHFHTSNIKLFF